MIKRILSSLQIYTNLSDKRVTLAPEDETAGAFTNLDTGDLLTIVPVILLPHFLVGALCLNPEV